MKKTDRGVAHFRDRTAYHIGRFAVLSHRNEALSDYTNRIVDDAMKLANDENNRLVSQIEFLNKALEEATQVLAREMEITENATVRFIYANPDDKLGAYHFGDDDAAVNIQGANCYFKWLRGRDKRKAKEDQNP